jgi:hypothetical protein
VIDQAMSQAKGLLGKAADAYRDATAYPKPICRLLVDGNDITNAIEKRLVSIELTDNRGMEADQLDIQLSDHDGLLAIPPRGAVLRLWLGWSDTGLVDKGSYTVDETEHSGAPDVLNIRARSADLRGGFKAKRERSWHATTLGAVVAAIAAAHGLSPVISAALSAIELLHQTKPTRATPTCSAASASSTTQSATSKPAACCSCPPAKAPPPAAWPCPM